MLGIVHLFILRWKCCIDDLSENQFSRKCDRNIYQLWSRKEVTCYSEKSRVCSVCRKINDFECLMFIKLLLSTYLLLKPEFSEKKRTINWCGVDLQLSWLKAKWVNSVVTSNIFSNELVCARKTKFLCLETDFHQSYEIWFAKGNFRFLATVSTKYI